MLGGDFNNNISTIIIDTSLANIPQQQSIPRRRSFRELTGVVEKPTTQSNIVPRLAELSVSFRLSNLKGGRASRLI